MEHGYPFSGTGSLNNFCSGLVKIGALNNIVIIYDNDTTGLYAYQITQKLNLPNNIKVMKLPELDSLNNFSTVGPSGVNQENINGKAASIECFLDLEWEKNSEPLVRWTSFNNNIEQYQGELVNKRFYTKKFLHLKEINTKYNYDKLNVLIDNIFNECVCISEAKIMN